MVNKKLLIKNLNSVVKVCSNYEEVIYGRGQKVEILKDDLKLWNVLVDKFVKIFTSFLAYVL